MRVLILGATGPLGGALAAHLHARGHAVVGVSRRRAEAFERHPSTAGFKATCTAISSPKHGCESSTASTRC